MNRPQHFAALLVLLGVPAVAEPRLRDLGESAGIVADAVRRTDLSEGGKVGGPLHVPEICFTSDGSCQTSVGVRFVEIGALPIAAPMLGSCVGPVLRVAVGKVVRLSADLRCSGTQGSKCLAGILVDGGFVLGQSMGRGLGRGRIPEGDDSAPLGFSRHVVLSPGPHGLCLTAAVLPGGFGSLEGEWSVETR